MLPKQISFSQQPLRCPDPNRQPPPLYHTLDVRVSPDTAGNPGYFPLDNLIPLTTFGARSKR